MTLRNVRKHMSDIVLPSVIFSALVGGITGGIVFLFRLVSEYVIELSHTVFSFAHDHPGIVPLVVAGAVLAALAVSACLHYSPHARGGGIPTAVALLRGLITFQWLRNLIFVFTSALLSYLCGIPLGNDEGPAVQMGAAAGSGVIGLLPKKYAGWERYLMTSGATAGFATATGAPISAVLFALEEAHRRITPLLLMSSLTGVISGVGSLNLLCYLTGKSDLLHLFHFSLTETLPASLIWTVVPVAILCGAFAFLFAKATRQIRTLLHNKFKNVSVFWKLAPVFAVVALIGCFYYESVGTGHHLIEDLIAHREVWYLSLSLLLVRAILVILSNDVGATGGLFTPLLVFGALIGSMSAEALIGLGIMEEQYFPLLVVIGMASFFSASVRTPLTAAVFSIEVFSGLDNILPIFLAIIISYLIVEIIGVTSINEIAIEREIHRQHKGKTRKTVDVHLVVLPGSFAVGKEPRDILWPAFCHVLSIREGEADEKDSYEGGAIKENDILRLNFTTYDPDATAAELCAILGEQPVYEKADVEHCDT